MKLNLTAIPNVDNYAVGSDWLKFTKINYVLEENKEIALRAEDISWYIYFQ